MMTDLYTVGYMVMHKVKTYLICIFQESFESDTV